MNPNNSKNNKYAQPDNKNHFNLYIIPILLVILVVPLVTRLYSGYTDIYQYSTGARHYNYFDLDLHYKGVVFTILALVMLILSVPQIIAMKASSRIAVFKRLIPLFVYVVFVIISYAASINKNVSLKGDYGQEEPLFVLLGYVVLLTYTFVTVKNETDIKWISYAAMANSFLVSLIGFIQFRGVDITQTGLYKLLVIPKQYAGVTTTGNGYVASTLMNSNYVGTYVCIMLPLVAVLLFVKSTIWEKLTSGAVSLMLIGFLLVSRSKTGMIILAAEFLVICLFAFKQLLKKWWLLLLFVLIMIVGLFAYNKYTNNSLTDTVKTIYDGISKKTYDLRGIDTRQNHIKILYKDYDLHITFDVDKEMGVSKLTCISGSDNIPFTAPSEDGSASLLLPDGSVIPIQLISFDNLYYGFSLKNELGYEIYIVKDEYNDYVVINALGNKVESKIDTSFLEGYESIATYRGRLWRSAFTVIPKYIFIGAGPDCYPNAVYKAGIDIVSVYHMSNVDTISARPHSYYIQTAINTGLLSLISCLTTFIWYIINCINLYFSKKINGVKPMGFACFLAVIGFLLCGLTNDSLICVSPLFWCALGVGMAGNNMSGKKVVNP